MRQVSIEYEIVEHYDDGTPPGAFGFQRFPLDHQPLVGEVIMLQWSDGANAYRARVDRIEGTTAHVRPLDERCETCGFKPQCVCEGIL